MCRSLIIDFIVTFIPIRNEEFYLNQILCIICVKSFLIIMYLFDSDVTELAVIVCKCCINMNRSLIAFEPPVQCRVVPPSSHQERSDLWGCSLNVLGFFCFCDICDK